MASKTQNYGYPKPEEEDFYDVGDFNRAMDMIDKDMKSANDATSEINEQISDFEQAEERENINPGDSLRVMLGKIKKFFADLKQVAFTGSYNDLSDKPTIPAAVRVKGNAEKEYHTGDVNITPDDIGAPSNAYMAEHFVPDYVSSKIKFVQGQGWYRIAVEKTTGNGSAACTIKLSRSYNYGIPEYQEIKLLKSYNSYKLIQVNAYTYPGFENYWTQIRLVKLEDGKCYIDIYNSNAEGTGTRQNAWVIIVENDSKVSEYKALEPYLVDDESNISQRITSIGLVANLDAGDYLRSGNPIPTVGKTGYIAYPSDAYYQVAQSNVSGHIRITLPVSWTYTFVKFTVSIFNMATGESCDYHISGYACAEPSFKWMYCTAVCVGKATSAHSNLSVRFGHDGTKCVVCIGETNTAWSYPVIQVHDVMVGYHQNDYDAWKSGWSIGFATTLPSTINETVQNTHVAHDGVARITSAALALRGWSDTRNVATTPNDYNSAFKCVGIKTPSACGLSDGSSYYTLFGVRGYGDSSGGHALEIAVSGSNGKLYYRTGATTTWGAWKTLADLTSTVSSATKATQDGNGNVIADTYAQKRIYGNNSVSCGARTGTVQTQSITFGYYGLAGNFASSAFGKYNKTMSGGGTSTNQIGDAFVIGNGYYSGSSGEKHSNALRVTYAGDVMGTKAFQSSGADYAEHTKEWADGNPDGEDRVGYMVTVKGGLLYKAQPGDYIAGITSGNPSVVGNADEDYYWRYERDEFNRIVMEDVPEMVQQTDEDGNLVFDEETHEPVMVETGNIIKNARMKLADGYDPSLQDSYVPRSERKEWDYVGMRGMTPVRDDGTCRQDHFCKCGVDGIATLAETRGFDTFYVIERISDNVVCVFI